MNESEILGYAFVTAVAVFHMSGLLGKFLFQQKSRHCPSTWGMSVFRHKSFRAAEKCSIRKGEVVLVSLLVRY